MLEARVPRGGEDPGSRAIPLEPGLHLHGLGWRDLEKGHCRGKNTDA